MNKKCNYKLKKTNIKLTWLIELENFELLYCEQTQRLLNTDDKTIQLNFDFVDGETYNIKQKNDFTFVDQTDWIEKTITVVSIYDKDDIYS